MARSMTGFGAALERICAANALTQKDVAVGIGVAPETVTRWKTEFSPPSGDLFRALAYLRQFEPGLSAEDLFGTPADPASTEAAS